jgi:cell division protein FtsL
VLIIADATDFFTVTRPILVLSISLYIGMLLSIYASHTTRQARDSANFEQFGNQL